MPRHRRLTTAIVLSMVAVCTTSEATPLALTTGLSVSMASGTTRQVTLSATNLAGGTGDITTFNGFGLALQLIPQAGATGTVQFAGFVVPASNGILSTPGDPQFELNGITNLAVVNGSSTATPVALLMAETAPQQETTVPQGVLKNLGTLSLVSSPNATGTWRLFAVNDGFGRSYWTDSFANETAFSLLPATNGASLQLGTVSIVPEPSTLAAIAGAAIVLAGRQRRRYRHSA